MVSSSPQNGAKELNADVINQDGIVIVFDEAVDIEKAQAGIQAGVLILAWKSSWSDGNTKLTLKPEVDSELQAGTSYRVVVSGVRDAHGNESGDVELTFMTKAPDGPVDQDPPFVISATVTDGAENMDPDGFNKNGIVFQFNEGVDTGKVTVSLMAGDQTLSWQASWSDGDQKLTLKPEEGSELAFGAAYVLVVLGVTDGAGNVAPEIRVVFTTKDPPQALPEARFVATPSSGLAPLTVQFSDRSTNGPFGWLWEFGDGATSDEKNPRHTYTEIGTYDVKLTVENFGGKAATTGTVMVRESTFPEPLGQEKLAGGEYFIDSDPGYGNGTAIPVEMVDAAEVRVNIPTGDLSEGSHTLYIRMQDEKGNWGIAEARSFRVTAETDVSLKAAEYFIDSDPGYGNGTTIPIAAAVALEVSINIEIGNLSSGFHTLFVRMQDQNDSWGIAEARPFYIFPEQAVSPLAEMEYFMNGAEPGLGNGTKLEASGSGPVNVTATLLTKDLDVGEHTVTIRAKNQAGIWGLGNTVTFVVDERGHNVAPVVARSIEKREVFLGGKDVEVNLGPVFTDGNEDALTFVVSSSDSSIAVGSVDGKTVSVQLAGIGGVTIVVRADDGHGGTVATQFDLVIQLPDNNAPVLVGDGIAKQELVSGNPAFTRDLSGVFSDADDEELTYTASSSDEAVVMVAVLAGKLEVTPVGEGKGLVTVLASDPKGGTVSVSFEVEVTRKLLEATVDVDIQAGDGDGALSQDTSARAKPGGTVTIEIFASNYDGAVGMVATFDIDPADAVVSAQSKASGAFTIVLGDGVMRDGSMLEAQFGNLGPVSESGEGLKLVGSLTLILGDAFENANITLRSVAFENGISRAVPDVALRVEKKPDKKTPDFDGDGVVGFTDFLMFAQVFGARSGAANFDDKFDLDNSGDVGFGDFLIFAQAFGKPVSSKQIRVAKPVGSGTPGLNGGVSLLLHSESGALPDRVDLRVIVSDPVEVQGYDLKVRYKASRLEFLGADALEGTSVFSGHLVGNEGRAPVAIRMIQATGEVRLVDAFDKGIRETGEMVRLSFRLLDRTVPGELEIVQVWVGDGSGRVNELAEVRFENLRGVPLNFALSQNYPNPFNPETVIPYQLPETGEVSLVIYNILGQPVREPMRARKNAGFYRAMWDGQDRFGRPVSSGIYLVRMVAGEFSAVRKVLLLK